uniref:Uncharacterized protein n=1 Tax=Anopheles funestus TaxID=62324 RepID=A0A182S276_ANOFN
SIYRSTSLYSPVALKPAPSIGTDGIVGLWCSARFGYQCAQGHVKLACACNSAVQIVPTSESRAMLTTSVEPTKVQKWITRRRTWKRNQSASCTDINS